MKGFFYFRMNLDTPEHIGVRKKVEQILKTFNELGVETDVAKFTNRGLEFNGKVLKEFSSNKIKRGWENNAEVHKILLKNVNFAEYDFAWMRVGLVLPWVFRFIKTAKKRNPKMNIFLEYGTYPFEEELDGFIKKLYPVSEYYLKRLRNQVDKIITFCGQDKIHEIPCIKMSNGINIEDYKWNPEVPEFTDTFHLIAVSTLHDWHAYDRVIAGIKNYYENDFAKLKYEVIFHIVGDGEEKENLQKMTKEFQLTEKIIFHGFKTGNELDEIFVKCHLAVGTLGMHRKNTVVDSSLKNREYCARGLPFVFATYDPDFASTNFFVKLLLPNDSAVSIENLILFYKSVLNKNNFKTQIRKFATERLSWKNKLDEVINNN